jgi:outer membrane immunogenic protein
MGGEWAADPKSTVSYQRFTGSPGVPHTPQVTALNSVPSGFGGAQFGYNWQLQQSWVVGLEADISFSGDSKNLGVVLAEGPITDTVTSTRGLDWFGTVRGRVGYLFTPAVLTYATGGLAYGHTRNDFTQAITGPGPVGAFTLANTSPSVRTGWTAGGGIEYAIDPKWSVKLEYDYLAFKDGVSSTNVIAFNPGKGGNQGVFSVHAANNSSNTVQVGFNYHFWN